MTGIPSSPWPAAASATCWEIYQFRAEDRALFVTDTADKYTAAVAAPIISEGDALGLVLFVGEGDGKVTGDTEYKLAQTIAAFLGKHMEG